MKRATRVLAAGLLSLTAAGPALSDRAAAAEPPAPQAKPAPYRMVEPSPQPLPAGSESELIRRRGFALQDVGFILTAPDGQVVAAHNAETAFLPASVAKLPTALAALEILGGDHRFRTRVAGLPGQAGQAIQKTLWLVGGGDPLFGPDEVMALCQQLRSHGVREVTGAFRYDDSRYIRREQIRVQQPEDVQYNPPVSALSLDFNRMRVEWRGRRDGRTVEAWTMPDVPAASLGGARPLEVPAGQRWTREDSVWRLAPDAPRDGSAWLPLLQPAKATAQLFRQSCARVGVKLPEPTSGTAPAEAKTLATVSSPPLTQVVQGMLQYSNNLVAELTGLAAGRALTREALDLEESSRLLADWLVASVPGTRWSTFAIGNHSGLNADARATPAQLAALLRYAQGRFYGDDRRSLLSLLPAAGWQSAFGNRLSRPETALRVWAKTGTMYFASGLAGYLLGSDGTPYSFAVFVNDRGRRQAYDQDPNRRAGRWRGEIASWRSRAKALEADLLRLWARRR